MTDTPQTPDSADLAPVRVLISYRREDSAGHAGRLYDSLIEHFGRSQVFIDIDAIEPGVDFSEVIAREVGSCDVLLAVIGREWVSIADAKGRRRLDNPDDFHRLEIQAALERNIRVIPLLVQNAIMPSMEELPEPIQKLALRNALELSDERWRYDVGRLITAVESVAKAKALRPREDSATPPPPATSAAETTTPIPPVPVPPPPAPKPPAPEMPSAPSTPERAEPTMPIAPPAPTQPLTPAASSTSGPSTPLPPTPTTFGSTPPSPPPSSGRSGPPRGLLIGIGAVVLILIIAVVAIAAGGGKKKIADSPSVGASPSLSDTPSTSPDDTPSPTVSPDDLHQQLIARVPSSFSSTCADDDANFLPTKALAGIKCTKSGAQVWYYLFSNGDDVDSWYETQRSAAKAPKDTGSCRTDVKAESQILVGGKEVPGRLFCFTDNQGAWIEWKRTDYKVYSYALRPDKSRKKLYDFWTNAGPYAV